MGVFTQRFEALFPHAGALGCVICFAPQRFLLVYLCANVELWGLLAATLPAPFLPQSTTSLGPRVPSLPQVLPTLAARLHPSYWSGWMFLLYLLGCQTSIQFHFLSVLVVFGFKLLLSFFWLCEEAQCVYVHLHLGRSTLLDCS